MRTNYREERPGSAGMRALLPSPAHAKVDGLRIPALLGQFAPGAIGLPADFLCSIIELIPIGIVVVDSCQRVVVSNRCASLFLRRRESLEVHEDGRICTVDPALRHAFIGFVHAVLCPHSERRNKPSLFLLAGGDKAPIPIMAMRVPVTANGGAVPNDLVLLTLRSMMARDEPSVENLRSLYGFTLAEAHLARALTFGKTVAECSAERGVSINTTKTQLNSLLSKTGLHRQVDLVRLLATI